MPQDLDFHEDDLGPDSDSEEEEDTEAGAEAQHKGGRDVTEQSSAAAAAAAGLSDLSLGASATASTAAAAGAAAGGVATISTRPALEVPPSSTSSPATSAAGTGTDSVVRTPLRSRAAAAAASASGGSSEGPTSPVDHAAAQLAHRISSGLAGISAGKSPALSAVQGGLNLIKSAAGSRDATPVGSPSRVIPGIGVAAPALSPRTDLEAAAASLAVGDTGMAAPPSIQRTATSTTSTGTASTSTARKEKRLRRPLYRGQLRFTGDPAQLRMSAAFWDAALRAAQSHADTMAEARTRGSSIGSDAAAAAAAAAIAADPNSCGHPAVDLVCSGLDSVRDSLISLVPHRQDMHEAVRSHIDTELFKRMLLARAFSHADWVGLLRYIGGMVLDLEAPARHEDTKAWLSGAEAHVKRIAQRRAERKARAGRRALKDSAAAAASKAGGSGSATAASAMTTPSRSSVPASSMAGSRTPVLGPAVPHFLAAAAGAPSPSGGGFSLSQPSMASSSSSSQPGSVSVSREPSPGPGSARAGFRPSAALASGASPAPTSSSSSSISQQHHQKPGQKAKAKVPLEAPVLDDDLLSLLPRVLAWVHWKVAQVRIDISNTHLGMLVPYLSTGGRGAEYERSKFESALAQGSVTLNGATMWMKRAVEECVNAVMAGVVVSTGAASGAGTGGAPSPSSASLALRSSLLTDSRIGRVCLLRDGLLWLLTFEHPLTMVATTAARNPDGYVRVPVPAAAAAAATSVRSPSPGPSAQGSTVTAAGAVPASPPQPPAVSSAAASAAGAPSFIHLPFPETLQLDAKRLTEWQNAIQRVALVATLSALVQQVVTTAPTVQSCSPTAAAEIAAATTSSSSSASSGSGELEVRSYSDLQRHLFAWLSDDAFRLEDLKTGLVSAADQLARKAGKIPIVVNTAKPAAAAATGASDSSGAEASNATPVWVEASSRLLSTLQGAVTKAVSTTHPLYATFQRRVIEALRRRITRELQDSMPQQSIQLADTHGADKFIPWVRFLDTPGQPLPSQLASAVPAACEDEVKKLVTGLARLVRHNHAVFEPQYKGIQSRLITAATGLPAGLGSGSS